MTEPIRVRTEDGYSFVRGADGSYTDGDMTYPDYFTLAEKTALPAEWGLWPYVCDACKAIPYKSRQGHWLCPEGCRDDNKLKDAGA